MYEITKPCSRQLRLGVLVAICLPTVMLGSGCRTSAPSMPTWAKPSWPSFGSKKEPSADTLAGIGPTQTYPVSPSASAVPNPIESVAASPAGVKPQTGQVAAAGSVAGGPAGQSAAMPGNQVGQAGGTSTAAPNSAAAIANGYSGPTPSYVTSPPAATSGASPTGPGGSLFGQPPTSVAATSDNPLPAYGISSPNPAGGAAASIGSMGPLPSASNYAAVGYPLPGAGPESNGSGTGAQSGQTVAGMPPKGFAETTPTIAADAAAPALPPGGFAMPGLPNESTASTSGPTTGGGFTMPGMVPATSAPATEQQPEAYTASAQPQGEVQQATGYTPGSTMGATSYPAGQTGQSVGAGSFYR